MQKDIVTKSKDRQRSRREPSDVDASAIALTSGKRVNQV